MPRRLNAHAFVGLALVLTGIGLFLSAQEIEVYHQTRSIVGSVRHLYSVNPDRHHAYHAAAAGANFANRSALASPRRTFVCARAEPRHLWQPSSRTQNPHPGRPIGRWS